MNVIDILITTAASATGAAITGLVGFRVAMSKLRRERGFTDRIAWYQSTIRKLSATGLYLVSLSKIEEIYDEERNPEHLTKAVDLMMRFFEVRQEAELYASNRAYNAIELVMGAIQDLIAFLPSDTPDPNSETYKEFLDMLGAAAYVFGQASSTLIDDMRKELGLGMLRRQWTWNRRRDNKKIRSRIQLHDLIQKRKVEGEWAFLDLALIERVLTRTKDAIAPAERASLAGQLEAYAEHLRNQPSSAAIDDRECAPTADPKGEFESANDIR